MANVRDFGARGDGKNDDTTSIVHAIAKGDGHVVFPRGDYVITRPLHVALAMHGRIAVEGAGGTARILMNGPGPAFHLVGTHSRSALPDHVQEPVWHKERMPTIRGLEIVGGHPQADGIRSEGAMQPTFQHLLIRRVRHGIHLANRDRNVLVSDCHIYHNAGIGIFLDRVNLHQTNIHGNHISYCKQGGIVITASEIRNLQICSNDIEYNHDLKADASADVLFDCRDGTVREGTITGNTIQAVRTPGGANVRFLGAKDHPNAVGLFAIAGNLLGSQSRVLDLRACRAVAVTGNSIYSGYQHALWAEDCEHLVLGNNTIDHNPEYRGTSTDQVVLRNCRNVNWTGGIIQHTRPATDAVNASMEIAGCQNVSVTGLQIVGARVHGIAVDNSSVVRIADCTIRGAADDKTYRAALSVAKTCGHMMVTNNMLGRGSDGEWSMPRELGQAIGNAMV
ncbi:MAG: right-handed parallel beta-helix repeat-containing protein [Gemmataceae bacterium]|nr:right-handed parallel beta-helix repeat-containing protein [Gemmataceae bacterium]